MALYSRIPYQDAENLISKWPPHRWYTRSVKWLLEQPTNQKNILKVPLNHNLLESIQRDGFLSPFLVLPNWYPITGSQRLRCAAELPDEILLQSKIQVCRFDTEYWAPFFHWYDKNKGQECVQVYFQMCEVVFKTLYMPETDNSGKTMVTFEEEGNQLHWPVRDGKPINPEEV